MALPVKDEFINTTDGWVGVVTIAINGVQSATAVEPHGFIWLSEDEQILTANAPRRDEDNPFIVRTPLDAETGEPIIDPESGEPVTLPPVLEVRTRGKVARSRRPFGGQTQDDEEVGAVPEPDDEPTEGSNAPGEEVATPAAAGARRRRK